MAGNLFEQGYYETGTASVTQGQTVVTGQGTAWSQIVRPADDFGKHVGRPIPIASVDSDTQMTLAYPWPGPTQAAAPYRVTFTPYHVAYRQALQEIGQLLSSGNVSALAGLTGSADKFPVFTGAGAMGLADTGDFAPASALDDYVATDDMPSFLADYLPRSGGAMSGALDMGGHNLSGVTTINGAGAFQWNWIMNGLFDVNERGGTRTPGINVYGFDRWKGHANGLEQVIEAMPTGTYTLSWSGGGVGTLDGTTGPSPLVANVSSGNVSAIVPSDANAVTVLRGDWSNLSNSILLPRSYPLELTLCKRYYEREPNSFMICFSGRIISGKNYYGKYDFEVEKRANPTMTLDSGPCSGFPDVSGTPVTGRKAFYESRTANATSDSGYFRSSWASDVEFY